MRLAVFVIGLLLFSPEVMAQQVDDPVVTSYIIKGAEQGLTAMVDWLGAILFYKLFGIPFLVFWLILGGLYFTLRLGFINIRMFGHAIQVVRGKYTPSDAPGEVTHFQALATAVSATVGLGNIAGVAVAVTVGGPGAVIWMMVFGFFAMSMKCAEVTLGQKYRHIDENGKVSGGAFHYLRDGLKEKGLEGLGRVLAVLFAILCIGGSLGGGNMFQSNQAVSILTDTFKPISNLDWAIALVLAISVGLVLIGGIKRIAKVASSIVPLMAIIYILAALTVLTVNAQLIPEAFTIMLQSALGGAAAVGGLIGVIIAGAQRAAFSNESGLGSAPIAHSAAKTDDPVKEGMVALLEPFIDTMVICLMTGLVITVTGVYNEDTGDGVLLTSAAFATVMDWFPMVLSFCIALFAFSTMISWSYYGERAWQYLFGKKLSVLRIYHIVFITFVFIGGVVNLQLVVNFSDLLLLSMSIPNLIGVYILSSDVKHDIKDYIARLKRGEIPKDPG